MFGEHLEFLALDLTKNEVPELWEGSSDLYPPRHTKEGLIFSHTTYPKQYHHFEPVGKIDSAKKLLRAIRGQVQ